MPKVRDILIKKGRTVHLAGPETTVLRATQLMNEAHIGSLVITHGTHVVGMFTERDVLVRVVAEGLDPATTPVGDIMTTQVAYCAPDTSLEQCSAIFTEKRIRHLPVMEGGHLVGVVTSGDVLAFSANESLETIKYLEEYIRS